MEPFVFGRMVPFEFGVDLRTGAHQCGRDGSDVDIVPGEFGTNRIGKTHKRKLAGGIRRHVRDGDFSGQSRAIFDPQSRTFNAAGVAIGATPFPDNLVPQARLNPVSRRLLEFFPAPTVPGNNLVSNFARNAKSSTDNSQFNQRIDWIENGKSSWFGRYSWGRDDQLSSGAILTDSTQVATTVRQSMISNTRILTTSTVNEARFAWNQFNNDLVGYFANTRDVEADLKIPGLFSASPLASTTSGARCLGTPRKSSQGSSLPSSSLATPRALSNAVTRRPGRKRIPRMANSATSAVDVSGDGGTGVLNGMTMVISQAPRTPRLVR